MGFDNDFEKVLAIENLCEFLDDLGIKYQPIDIKNIVRSIKWIALYFLRRKQLKHLGLTEDECRQIYDIFNKVEL